MLVEAASSFSAHSSTDKIGIRNTLPSLQALPTFSPSLQLLLKNSQKIMPIFPVSILPSLPATDSSAAMLTALANTVGKHSVSIHSISSHRLYPYYELSVRDRFGLRFRLEGAWVG